MIKAYRRHITLLLFSFMFYYNISGQQIPVYSQFFMNKYVNQKVVSIGPSTTKALKEGHVLTNEDIIAKRPNTGDFLAEDIELLIGKKVNRDIGEDEKLFRHHFENMK